MTAVTARMNIQSGALPLDTDLLNIQRFVQSALGQIIAGTLGSGTTLVDGFTCIPTTPATLAVQVTPGAMFALEAIDATSFGSLSSDSTQIMKVGTLTSTQTLSITPPSTGGYSQCFLIEAAFSEADGVPIVLSFYNATTPSSPLNGPSGSGNPTNTQRICSATLTLKAGIAALTGTQTTPAPDANNVGLFVVTVANGALSLTSANIATYSAAPFIPAKLPAIPAVVQNSTWTYAVDTSGAANTIAASLSPTPAALTAGMRVYVKIANSITGATTFNLNGLGAVAVIRTSGAALGAGNIIAGMMAELSYDGTSWQLLNPCPDPVGMKTIFFQATAPLGWTQITTYNDIALRVVNGTGGGTYTAGQSFTAAVATGTVDGHAVTTGEMPVHAHGVTDPTHAHTTSSLTATVSVAGGGSALGNASGATAGHVSDYVATGITIQNQGSGSAHSHTFTSSAFNINYINMILCSRN